MDPVNHSAHRVSDGIGYVWRNVWPMLLALSIPAAAVLGIALLEPPAQTPTVAPLTDPVDDPLAGFEFEPVGVGVKRVVHDGAGHRPGNQIIAIEPHGSVLSCCYYHSPIFSSSTDGWLARLGESEPVATWDDERLAYGYMADMEVGPDGAIWSTGHLTGSLEDGVWTTHRKKGFADIIEVAPDGTAWTDLQRGSPTIVRYRNGKARIYTPGSGLPKTLAGWDPEVTAIATAADGTVWAGVSGWGPRQPGGLLRFDGKRWRIVRPMGRGIDARVEGVAAAPDGTIWVYLSRNARKSAGERQPTSHLARLDGKGWTVFHESDGVPPLGPRYAYGGNSKVLMEAGRDGSIWLTPLIGFECRRLMRFDGEGSRSYLGDGACVDDLELDAQGNAWVAIEWLSLYGADSWGTDLYLLAA